MTQTAEALHADPQLDGLAEAIDTSSVQLVQVKDHALGPDRSERRAQAILTDRRAQPSGGPACARPLRSWPLLILALPAAVAVWSGWVGIGRLTGFGEVHPLPGIWDSLHLDTAVTLPVGVEAYAAYALRAWFSSSTAVSARTRRFARWSATGSLVLGMAGQVAYHLLTQAHSRHAPWGITTAVSCLPVLVLGMGAALAHMIRADAYVLGQRDQTTPPEPRQTADEQDQSTAGRDRAITTIRPDKIAEATTTAARLAADGHRISRRSLRNAGVHGSNTDLGMLAQLTRQMLRRSQETLVAGSALTERRQT
ncbi:MAG: hypothetical protein ACRDPY_14385 [Streptosporangiaceae bacterium]